MRQLGTLPKELDPKVFADYLLTLGMKTRVDERPDGWSLWIYNEDHLTRAREELSGYLSTPDDPRYRSAVDSAKSIRREEKQLDQKFRKNFREAADIWGYPSLRRRPVTVLIGVLCLVVFFLYETKQTHHRVEETLRFSTDIVDERRPRTQQRDEGHRARRDLAIGDADLPSFRHRAPAVQRDGALLARHDRSRSGAGRYGWP